MATQQTTYTLPATAYHPVLPYSLHRVLRTSGYKPTWRRKQRRNTHFV